MAVDLGTTNAVVYVRGRGIVLSEPTLVAVHAPTGDVRAVGADAKRVLKSGGGSIISVRPVKRGVITDLDRTKEMLSRFIRSACRSHRRHPRLVVMGMPCGATRVEKRTVEQACLSAGARHALLIEAPMAAAIGAELPVDEAVGSLVVDVGGGTCETAVISFGEIVVSRSIPVGGDDFDEAITKHLKRKYGLLIDDRTAEDVRLEIGSTYPLNDALQTDVRGREIRSGLPKNAMLTSGLIREALEKPVSRIIDTVRETLADTPPELGADIIDRGIVLTGGGSMLRGLKERLRHETQMPVELAELPLTCVAAGSGTLLEELATDRRFGQEVGEWVA